MTPLDRSTSVAQLVLDHPPCARIFHHHRVDYCCRGELSLAAACAAKALDVDAVASELERAIAAREQEVGRDPRTMSTPDLIAHIVARHHAYLNEALPFLEPLAAKVARVHGDRNPKLLVMLDTFRELRSTLEPHLREEERDLFPSLTALRTVGERLPPGLATMRDEHLRVGELLTILRTLSEDFRAPDWACGSYRALLDELEALEVDTMRHVHLENHVLMPRFAPAPIGQPTSSP